MLPVKMKKDLKDGHVVIGPSIAELYTPVLARLFGRVGFDWLHIELEHVLMDEEQLYNFIAAGDSAGIPSIVKLPELSRNFVCRSLDGGAAGVRLTWVETRQEMEKLVAWAKYPPDGIRPFWNGANTEYHNKPFTEYAPIANANTIVMAHVETRKGIENIDEICKVKNVDVAIIGPSDLSISLGVPDRTDDPRFLEAAKSLVRACESNKVVPGMSCSTVEDAKKWISRGFRCLDLSSEWEMLHSKASDELKELRKVLGYT